MLKRGVECGGGSVERGECKEGESVKRGECEEGGIVSGETGLVGLIGFFLAFESYPYFGPSSETYP